MICLKRLTLGGNERWVGAGEETKEIIADVRNGIALNSTSPDRIFVVLRWWCLVTIDLARLLRIRLEKNKRKGVRKKKLR